MPPHAGAGVHVNLWKNDGGLSVEATTNASGVYTFSGIANGIYTITPITNISGNSFSPSNITCEVEGENSTGNNFNYENPYGDF